MPITNAAAHAAAKTYARSDADSFRRLADVFHHLLSEHGSDAVLERIADALADIVPHDALVIY